jgi:hypothetical protein
VDDEGWYADPVVWLAALLLEAPLVDLPPWSAAELIARAEEVKHHGVLPEMRRHGDGRRHRRR